MIYVMYLLLKEAEVTYIQEDIIESTNIKIENNQLENGACQYSY